MTSQSVIEAQVSLTVIFTSCRGWAASANGEIDWDTVDWHPTLEAALTPFAGGAVKPTVWELGLDSAISTARRPFIIEWVLGAYRRFGFEDDLVSEGDAASSIPGPVIR